nr:2534_t:CDS:2 [Entrophospora candida]
METSPGQQHKLFEDFFNAISLPKLVNHWHVLLLSTLACSITLAISRILSSFFFPKIYNSLQGVKRVNWDIHFVSMVHCCLVVYLSVPLLFDKELEKDKVFGYNIYAGNVYAFSCGYFLWDALISLYYVKDFGIGFVLHGACCFGVYLFAFRPFLNYYGPVFLMFEVSTPFLNIHWFMDKLGKTGSLIQLINGICLLLSFFFFRIVFGIYMSYHALQSVLPVASKIPTSICLIYGVSNIILNLLNIFWFKKMIDALLKRFSSNNKVEAKKHFKSKEVIYHNVVTYSATNTEIKSKKA